MSERRRKCRVCKVEKAVSTLDSMGRCQSCATALEATKAGMSYGKYTALKREGQLQKQMELQKRLEEQRYSETYCKNCGGYIPKGAKYEGCCCRECQLTLQEREQKGDAYADKKNKPTISRERVCRNCGKAITGNRRYCSERCKYVFNQERIMKQQRDYRERKKGEGE